MTLTRERALAESHGVRARRPIWWLLGAVLGVAVVAGVTALWNAAPSSTVSAPPLAPAVPLASSTGYYVDPSSPAARQQQAWAAAGRTDDARRIGEIAAQPIPDWLTQQTGAVAAEVKTEVAKAHAVGQRPLFVAYHIPDRDCGGFSGGGAADAADYRAWIRQMAGALNGAAATVVLEPDAVPHEVAGCAAAETEERDSLLSDAVAQLKASGPITVYLDAGNPGFVADVGALADALQRSGVGKADGFALNVANFYPTDEVLAYGHKISAALGGKHFVVDTSRNGNGRPSGDTVAGGPAYCNPPGRKIGPVPTTDTGDSVVDAYLWVKRVGESDGSCRAGEPPAGQWWPEYALSLVPN